MFIRKKRSPHNKNKVSVQIVESVRTGDKVSQTILRHIGTAEQEDELQALLDLAKSIKIRLEEERQPSLPLFDPERLFSNEKADDDKPINVNLKDLREEQRFNEGIIEVFGTLYNELSFDTIFTGRFAKINNSILKSCVLARIANPSSKLQTSELLENDFAIKLPVDKIYRMMTQLEEKSDNIKKVVRNSTLSLLDNKVNVLLFDVTTLYFESFIQDDLRAFGFSKDCKFKETQVVFALIATTDGLPITYKIFPGNTHEISTLIPVIEELKKEFKVDNIEFAADRGMFCENNLKELENTNIKYVVAAKLKTMSKEIKNEILSINDNNDEDKYQIKEIDYKGRRLIINYSPIRASKDKKDRERLLERLKKIVDKDGKVTTKKLVQNAGTKKYLTFEDDKKNAATINNEKISNEEKWDGIYGYITNSKSSAEEIISKYKRLWEIEESFRINKHDLRVRPIFHHKGSRILAHLDICFLCYALVRQLMFRYEVQQNESISFAVIRRALLEVQSSMLIHTKTKERYIVPSKTSPLAKKIYRILGLKRSLVPYRFN